jgi:hypothetical protein
MSEHNEVIEREVFDSVEDSLVKDSNGELARRLVGYYDGGAARVRARLPQLNPSQRVDAQRVIDAFEAAAEIVRRVWSNVHPGKGIA